MIQREAVTVEKEAQRQFIALLTALVHMEAIVPGKALVVTVQIEGICLQKGTTILVGTQTITIIHMMR